MPSRSSACPRPLNMSPSPTAWAISQRVPATTRDETQRMARRPRRGRSVRRGSVRHGLNGRGKIRPYCDFKVARTGKSRPRHLSSRAFRNDTVSYSPRQAQRNAKSDGREWPRRAVAWLGMARFAAVMARSDVARNGDSTGLAAIGREAGGWRVAGRWGRPIFDRQRRERAYFGGCCFRSSSVSRSAMAT
jgi:hypothetical protein